MDERRKKERWREKLYTAMRRLERLRALRSPDPDPRNAQIDEAIAKEPEIIRECYEAAAKDGSLPEDWPVSVAAVAKELGLLNATQYADAQRAKP